MNFPCTCYCFEILFLFAVNDYLLCLGTLLTIDMPRCEGLPSGPKKVNTRSIKKCTEVSSVIMDRSVSRQCTTCCQVISNDERTVTCDICDSVYHVECSGLPEKVVQTFLNIVRHVAHAELLLDRLCRSSRSACLSFRNLLHN